MRTHVHPISASSAARSPPGSACRTSPTTTRSSRSAATFLADLRWPGGVECPRCSETSRLLWLESRSKWHCYACRYQFSVTAGTLFHSSHLPVWKWFVAVHLMLDRAERHLGQRASADDRRQLQDGLVRGPPDPGRDARPRRRAAAEPRRGRAARERADLDRGPTCRRRRQQRCSRMRRVAGPHHQLSAKYLPAYIDERRWRSANRDNPHVFRDTISPSLQGEGISYERLVAAG